MCALLVCKVLYFGVQRVCVPDREFHSISVLKIASEEKKKTNEMKERKTNDTQSRLFITEAKKEGVAFYSFFFF